MRNLATSLFEHGSIRTTFAKAKELRGVADHLITFAKRGDLHARRQVLRRIQNKAVVGKLFDEIGPAYTERNGGYTRVLKLGPRRGDSTELCLVELVGNERRSEYAKRSASSDPDRTERPAQAAEEPAGDRPAADPVDPKTAEEAGGAAAADEEEKVDS